MAVRTLVISGFPVDSTRRELKNLCRFFPGFDAAHVQDGTHGKAATLFAKFVDTVNAQHALDMLNGRSFDPEEKVFRSGRQFVLMASFARRELDVRKSLPLPPAPKKRRSEEASVALPAVEKNELTAANVGACGLPAGIASGLAAGALPAAVANLGAGTSACSGNVPGAADLAALPTLHGLEALLTTQLQQQAQQQDVLRALLNGLGGGVGVLQGLGGLPDGAAQYQAVQLIAGLRGQAPNVGNLGQMPLAGLTFGIPPAMPACPPAQASVQGLPVTHMLTPKPAPPTPATDIDTIAILSMAEKGLTEEYLRTEFQTLPGFLQMKVNPKIGAAFAKFETKMHAEAALLATNALGLGGEWARRSLQ